MSPEETNRPYDLATLQDQLESDLRRFQVVGASVAIYHAGRFAAAAAGSANLESAVPINAKTVMHIGSIAKLFTATLIMQLAEAGLIGINDRILSYLPDLRLANTEALSQITIKMLLNHSSGIDGDVPPDHGHDEETIDKAIDRFAHLGQIHMPAQGYSYCNGGYVILGHLAQRVTGQSWYSLIRDRLFAPLNMRHAVTLPEEALLYSASVGHFLDPKSGQSRRTSKSLLPLSFSPGGTTLMMSATDLVTFARMHLDGGCGLNGTRILTRSSTDLMREQTLLLGEAPSRLGIALGWHMFDHGVYGHGGGAPGVSSMLYILPSKNFAAAILTNSAHGRALVDEIMRPWFNQLIGQSTPYMPRSSTENDHSDTADLERFAGDYENILSKYRVIVEDGKLGMSMCFKHPLYDGSKTEFGPPVPLRAIGGGRFILNPTEKNSGALLGSSQSINLAFINPDAHGRTEHLALPASTPEGRLYRRSQ